MKVKKVQIKEPMAAFKAYRQGDVYMSFFSRKWKMHLYLNGIYVGKVRIKENEEPSKNIYVVHFWFKKQIFKAIHVKCVIHPTNIMYTDKKRKITHWQFEYEEGVKV